VPHQQVDALVIGGGFYGCAIALELRRAFDRVVIVEKEADLLQRASFNNQARIHQGYHYPRSILTALRSRVNFSRFVQEFGDCVDSSFGKYYPIARLGSKVNAAQFRSFCERIGAQVEPAPPEVKRLFNANLIEDVFRVTEYAFDSVKLKNTMLRQLHAEGVEVRLRTTVERVSQTETGIMVWSSDADAEQTFAASHIFNCAYSQLNRVLKRSGLPIVPLKHEFTEMVLVEVPEELTHLGITVMDGAFFSVMPFPARGLHSLSHVRYTPHQYWHDAEGGEFLDAHAYFASHRPRSNFVHMIKDAERYLPVLAECRYVESLWEVKTILPRSEVDDSRPILYRAADQLPGLTCILGGKIDNIYDIRARLAEDLGSRGRQA
jgi:glycine/D-amino acid oxidase-like deaminating enzyme